MSAGDYLLKVDGSNTTLDYSFKLSNLNQAAPLAVGTQIADSFDRIKGTDLYKFDATAGEKFFFDFQQMNGSYYSSYYGSQSQWRLIDPLGVEVFDQSFGSDARDQTLSKTGTYTLLIEDNIGDSLYLSPTANYRFRVEKLNQPVALNLGETITNKLTQKDYTFTLNENSKLYFDSLTESSDFKWTLTKADGTAVVNQRRFDQSDSSSINDPILNLSAGDYLLKVDGSNTTLDYSFKLSNLNQAAPLAVGTQIADSFDRIKGTDLYKFDATAGEKFFFDFQQMNGSYNSSYYGVSSQWRLIDPLGVEVFDQSFASDARDQTLSKTGTYTLLIEDNIGDSLYLSPTANYRFRVEKLNPPVALNLGETVSNKLTQKDYTFTLNENSKLYFDALTNNGFNWSLTKADGTTVVNQRAFTASDSLRIDNPVLKLDAGEYRLKIDGSDTTLDYSFKLSNFNQAQALTLGTPVNDSFEIGKKTDLFKFDATAGEKFFFDYQQMTGSIYGASSTQWRLIDPSGAEVFDQRFSTDASNITTSQTGTYTLLIENDIYDQANSSGSINYGFRVEKLNPAVALNLGETVTNKLTQKDYTFILNENSLLYFDALTNSSDFKWTLSKADGTAVVNQRRFDLSDASSIANPVLNLSAGDYRLKVDGSDTTLNYSFKLSNLNQALALTLGTPINDSFETGKKTDLFRFDATAGERFFFDYQAITGSNSGAQWRLIDPQGNEVFDQAFTTDASNITTSQTGTYTLLIENDIADSPRNATSINYRFQVDPISADLTVTNATAPTSVTWGQPFTLNWQVANIGSLTSTGWSDRLYLSKDTTLDDNDVLLSTFNDAATTPLVKNATASRSKELTINTLQNLDSSTNWHLLVKAQTNQRDANTSNDVRATAIQLLPPTHPDLIVPQVTAPTTGISGNEIEVNWQVKNQGNLTTNTTTWSDRIILSKDNVLDNSDRQLGIVSHTGALNQNGIYSNTAKVRLPEEISGDYYLLVDTDYHKQVFEFVYDQNNATSTTTPTTISLKPVPDLQVNSVTADTTGEPGENIKVNWQVSNTGAAAATGNWHDYIYLSSDGTLNNARHLKSIYHTEPLAVNGNYQGASEVTLPDNLVDGNYRLVVVTDGSQRVFERDGENNNSKAAANLTKVNHADLIPTLITAPNTGNSGTNVTLRWSVVNQGTTATSNSWSDRVYLSDNATFEADKDRLFGEFAFYGLYQGMSKGLLLAAISDRVSVNLRGTAFGAIALASGIVLFPANLIAGLLWEQVNYQAPFIFGSILAIAATLLLVLEVRNLD